jgi:hypothetical protein
MVPFDKRDYLKVLEWASVLIVSSAMLIYGVGKLVQFGAPSVDKPVSELTGMELMWAFYGYSKAYALLLGALEVTGGLLLLLPRTRLLGALFITTILVNVIIQDVVYEVNRGALKAAIIYQAFTFLILWLNRRAVWEALVDLSRIPSVSGPARKKWVMALLAVLLAALIKWIEFQVTH